MATVTCPNCKNVHEGVVMLCPVCGTAVPPIAQPVPQRPKPPHLRLSFSFGDIVIAPGEAEILGRDPEVCRSADRFDAHDNVSRRHANARVDEEGTAFVEDLDSTNGTYLNGSRLKTGAERRLREGDQLRLAVDVPAKVRFTVVDDSD